LPSRITRIPAQLDIVLRGKTNRRILSRAGAPLMMLFPSLSISSIGERRIANSSAGRLKTSGMVIDYQIYTRRDITWGFVG
jgi:hypothetical protein